MANTLSDTFKAYIKKECNSLVWLYPEGCTDALRAIDPVLGAFIKVEVGKQLDLWLGNGDNRERWETDALTSSDRRVLLTKWSQQPWTPSTTVLATGFACSKDWDPDDDRRDR